MKISVALCTCNGERFIGEQIDSILRQSLSVDEIIVCDDRSSDKTVEIIEKYASLNTGRFKIYINETRLRSVKNFEKAISLCSGDIIFLSDQDDVWSGEKVARVVDEFTSNAGVGGVFTNGVLIGEKNEPIDSTGLWGSVCFDPRVLKKSGDLFTYLTQKRNVVTGATLAIRREVLDDVIPFPEVEKFYHDHWIGIVLSHKDRLSFISEDLIHYRIHRNQQVGTPLKKNWYNRLRNELIDDFILNGRSKSFLVSKKIKRILHSNIQVFENVLKAQPKKSAAAILERAVFQLNEKLKG